MEAVAFHDLDLVATRAACASLCASLRSVYLASLDFGVGVHVFVHEAGRRGLDLRFATRPLRAVGDPKAMSLWAGTGWRSARAAPVAEVLDALTSGG